MQPTYTYSLGLFIPLILGTLFLLFSGFIFYRGWRGQKQVRASQAWPSAPGMVTAARIQRLADQDSSLFAPVIEYTYNVENTPMEGSRYAFTPTLLPQAQAQALIERYQPDTPVTVYYNPNDLREAVLERRVPPAGGMVIIAGILAVLGLSVCCVGGVGLLVLRIMR